MRNGWVITLVVLLNGCVHDASSYPEFGGNAKNAGIEHKLHGDSPCPDLSGVYEGRGRLVGGDPTAKQAASSELFDMVFPISHPDEWKTIRANYATQGSGKIFVAADYARVTNTGGRAVFIYMAYKDRVIGSYHSEYLDDRRFSCIDGKLVWGGADKEVARSEWGMNNGSRSFSIYKDQDGNLIHERRQQVHMHILGGIPAGTGQYFAIYKFKKVVNTALSE